MRDFTLAQYRKLCQILIKRGYAPQTVRAYIEGGSNNGTGTVVFRHDVDRKISNALRMAKIEHALGICSTYYFRYPRTFKPEIISAIHDLGHEVGYHYETLSIAKGDYDKAIRLFEQGLAAFRKIPHCKITTICMHGSPLSRYDNRDLWKRYDFRDYGIEGEAYLSMTGKPLQYLTDTGRSWSGRHSRRDAMLGTSLPFPPMETTKNLVAYIEQNLGKDLYITVHPERWSLSEGEWIINYSKDVVFNLAKKILIMVH